MKFPRAIVTGGRQFNDYQRIEDDLRALRSHGLRRVAEGASPGGGADDHVHDAWRRFVGESTARYPIDSRLDGYHRGAPNARNVRMVKAEHDLAVDAGELIIGLAYPDPQSRGTWHCVAEMLKRGVPVVVWAPHALNLTEAYWRPAPLYRCVSDGLQRHAVRDPLVFDWGTPRGGVAPVGLDEADFAALALQVREALGE